MRDAVFPSPAEAGDERELPHPAQIVSMQGHAAGARAMLDAYRSRRLHHAWLLGGPEGIGKATLAWHFARFVLVNPDPAAPDVQSAETLAVAADSAVTRRLVSGSHGDLAVLRRQWNEKTKKPYSEIRVDDVRQALGLFQRASASGGYRICIIDSAEDLNRSSANALLKVIEEPPPRSLFLIVAHRPGQVMPTLVSRARRLLLSPPNDVEAVAAVRALGSAWASVEEERLTAAAARARGSVGEILRLLEGETLDLGVAAGSLLTRLPEVDWPQVHRLADRVGTSDGQLAVVLRTVFAWLEAELHARQRSGARALVGLAESWEAIRAAAREADVLNLDKRPLILSIFADLARGARPTT